MPNQSQNENTHKPSSTWEVIERTAVTILAVNTTLFPLCVYQDRLQTGYKPHPRARGISLLAVSPFLFNAEAIRRAFITGPLASAYWHGSKAAAAKNGVMVNHEYLSGKSKPSKAAAEEEVAEQVRYTARDVVATAAVVGTLDSVATNYFSAMRVLNTVNVQPRFKGMFTDWYKRGSIWRLGLGVKTFRNFLNAYFFIASASTVKQMAERYLPPERYGQAGSVVSSVGAGILAGLFCTPLEVLRKNQVVAAKQAVTGVYQQPKLQAVTRELYRNGGVARLFRGAGTGVAQSVVAFGTINFVEQLYRNRGLRRQAQEAAQQQTIANSAPSKR